MCVGLALSQLIRTYIMYVCYIHISNTCPLDIRLSICICTVLPNLSYIRIYTSLRFSISLIIYILWMYKLDHNVVHCICKLTVLCAFVCIWKAQWRDGWQSIDKETKEKNIRTGGWGGAPQTALWTTKAGRHSAPSEHAIGTLLLQNML